MAGWFLQPSWMRFRWPTDKGYPHNKPTHTVPWHQHTVNVQEARSASTDFDAVHTVSQFGQMISFGIEDGGDQRFSGVRTITVQKGNDTVRKICKNAVHPDLEARVLRLNAIRNPTTKLAIGRRVRIPDRMRDSQSFHVLADDQPPRITSGYSKIGVIDRTERCGISVFQGYDPIVIEIPVRFEAEDRSGSWAGADGSQIEKDIQLLEQMAGRGIIAGAAIGAPPIIRIQTRDNAGNFVGLIPRAYQWTRGNPNNQFYWISGIDWDADALRNRQGERIRQRATITVTQYVTPDTLAPSAAERVKALTPKKKPKKPAKHTTRGRR
jgi:hypothetical protein